MCTRLQHPCPLPVIIEVAAEQHQVIHSLVSCTILLRAKQPLDVCFEDARVTGFALATVLLQSQNELAETFRHRSCLHRGSNRSTQSLNTRSLSMQRDQLRDLGPSYQQSQRTHGSRNLFISLHRTAARAFGTASGGAGCGAGATRPGGLSQREKARA